jgi:hypothetical protein
MTKSKYLALGGAVAAAAIAAGAFVCAKSLTEYFERQHQRRQVEGFVKKIFGDSDDVASLLRVSDKLRSLKDSASEYAGSARDQGMAAIDRLKAALSH